MKAVIPQIILPTDISVVEFLQKKYPCTECLKECKSVWVTMGQLNDSKDELLDIGFCTSRLRVMSSYFDIEHICYSAGDIKTLKDCDSCIHFHDAIIKDDKF